MKLYLNLKCQQSNEHLNRVMTQATLRENKSNVYQCVIPEYFKNPEKPIR